MAQFGSNSNNNPGFGNDPSANNNNNYSSNNNIKGNYGGDNNYPPPPPPPPSMLSDDDSGGFVVQEHIRKDMPSWLFVFLGLIMIIVIFSKQYRNVLFLIKYYQRKNEDYKFCSNFDTIGIK
jgi:hypothetical protein